MTDDPTPAGKGDAPFQPDESLRREAAQHLASDLKIGSNLIARCEEFALRSREDHLAPMYAAARLMSASAKLADSLSTAAQVERRRRSIVERIEPINRKQRELNEWNRRQVDSAEVRLKIWRRMNEHIEESIRARCGETGATDSVASLIQQEEEIIARCQRQMDEAEADQSEAGASWRAGG